MILLLLSLMMNFSHASVNTTTNTTALDVKELLTMPEKNRMAVVQSQPSYYTDLIQVANSEQSSIEDRWSALMLAVESNPQRSVSDLKRFAQHKMWFMKNAALVGLKKADLSQAIIEARKLIKDQALVVRSAAVDVLAASETAMDKDLLWKELNSAINYRKEQSLWIRPQIVRALIEKSKSSDATMMAQQLKIEGDEEIKTVLVSALEKMNGYKGEKPKTLADKVDYWRAQYR